jgi:hypothetical protein
MKKILIVTLCWMGFSLACETRRNTVPPEQAASQFAQDLGLKTQGKPNCAQIDSDNDGYVTCTIALVAKEGQNPEILSLQCAGVTGDAGCENQTSKYVVGCKKTEPKVQVKSE